MSSNSGYCPAHLDGLCLAAQELLVREQAYVQRIHNVRVVILDRIKHYDPGTESIDIGSRTRIGRVIPEGNHWDIPILVAGLVGLNHLVVGDGNGVAVSGQNTVRKVELLALKEDSATSPVFSNCIVVVVPIKETL